MNRVLQAALMAAMVSNQVAAVSAQALPPAAQLRGSAMVTKQALAQFIRPADRWATTTAAASALRRDGYLESDAEILRR